MTAVPAFDDTRAPGPRHVAIIMDGNGRWAKRRHMPRVLGHQRGVEAVRRTVRAAAELGLSALTLYAFSTENWRRPRTEVIFLMSLMRRFLISSRKEIMDNNIRMKGLTNFSLVCYYDAAWPYGNLFVWPWPQANIYAIGITVREQLPQAFSLAGNPLAVEMNLPFEYYRALVKNIAMEVRPKYGIANTPGDLLAAQARDALDTLRRGNTQIPLLSVPPGLAPRPGMYNIFSDQSSM